MQPITTEPVALLFLLLVGHMLADHPLQGPFLSMAKNHRKPVDGFPWYLALVSHTTIQSGVVFIVTGSLWFAAIEFIAHTTVDWMKCDERLTAIEDQALHVLCKLAYVWVAASWGMPS